MDHHFYHDVIMLLTMFMDDKQMFLLRPTKGA